MAGIGKYIKSAVDPKDFPASTKKEIAFVGRSNAGKSSLINAICQSQVAKVSNTPGKTRLISFFDLPSYLLVDMPGYGYAARSLDEMDLFQKMIENYFSVRSQVAALVLVMDSRRDWSEDEDLLRKYSAMIGKPLVVAATKLDKLNQSERIKRLKAIKSQSQSNLVFLVSSESKQGLKDFEDFLFHNYIKDQVQENKS